MTIKISASSLLTANPTAFHPPFKKHNKMGKYVCRTFRNFEISVRAITTKALVNARSTIPSFKDGAMLVQKITEGDVSTHFCVPVD